MDLEVQDPLGVRHLPHRRTPPPGVRAGGQLHRRTAAVRVVEGGGAHLQAPAEVEGLARGEVGEREPCAHHVERHREHGLVHVARDRLADAALFSEVPREHAERVVGLEGGGEEREPVHVVPVGVAEEDVGVERPFPPQLLAERADAGARVEDDEPRAHAHLDAARVPAEAHVGRRRAGDAPAHPPEADRQCRGDRGAPPLAQPRSAVLEEPGASP